MRGPTVVRYFVLLALFAGLAHADSKNAGKKFHIERVVAVVNEAVILQSELDARLVPLRAEAEQIQDLAERKRRLAKLASQVLDEMVNEELIVQSAEQAK